MNKGSKRKTILQATVAFATVLVAREVRAESKAGSAATISFAIEGGSLKQALVNYAAASGIQLLYSSDIVDGRAAPRVVGGYTAESALEHLLQGSGLVARRVGAKVYVLEKAANGARIVSYAPAQAAQPNDPEAVGTLPASKAQAPVAIGSNVEAQPGRAPDEIIVTGSHIRGQAPGAPPTTNISRGDLERSGYGSIAQALQALPSNFSGTASEQSGLNFADTTGTNATLATGVNLRGLGAGATLVLVNGQRLAGSGLQGAFADVSNLPAGALDHIEVLLDGASAVYGSDAVGGVVNVLLRRTFKGAETRARFGSVTSGGRRTVQLDQTLGTRWSTGGIMGAYEYDRTGRLTSASRDFARTTDFRSLGGTDHRYIFALPGNVLGIDPATGGLVAKYAIPDGQNGTGLTRASFLPGVTNFENNRVGTDLIPRQERHSGYASIDQELGDAITLNADVRYTHRAFDARRPGGAAVVSINGRNPYFVSPTGAASDIIAYSFVRELGQLHSYGVSKAFATSAGLEAKLGGSWRLRAYGAFGQETEHSITDHMINTTALAEAVGTTADNPATPFNTAVDGFFNPYGTGSSNSAAMIAYIGNGFNDVNIHTRITTGHVDGDGRLFDLPGGTVKLAVGADVRRESFNTLGMARSGAIGVRTVFNTSGDRTVKAGFAELRVPLVGEGNAMAGIEAVALSLSGRIEDYPEFGATANPKFGVSWVPIGGLTLRASYGTSFRAPNLRQLKDAQLYSVTTLARADRTTVPVIQLVGGNPNLTPEKARSWTYGFDLQPQRFRGLHVSATGFHTVFSNRIATPANDNFANALTDPSLTPFVQLLSPLTNPADLARINALLASPAFAGSNSFPSTSIAAIIDTRFVNTGRVTVSGIDFSAGYSWSAGRNRFDVGASGTYLAQWREQVTPTSESFDRLNLVGRPVDLRGRATIGWERGAANAQFGVNYVAPYHDLTGRRIAAWRTVDLEIGVKATTGWLKGTSISVAVTNLFDTSPPFYDAPQGPAYDAANADAMGRVVALQVSCRW